MAQASAHDKQMENLMRTEIFMLCIEKSSLTRSVAPPLKLAIASLDCEFVFLSQACLFFIGASVVCFADRAACGRELNAWVSQSGF